MRVVIGPDDQSFADGSRFLLEVGEFREWTGLKEGLAINMSQALTLAVAVLCVGALFYFLQRTRAGKAMRAARTAASTNITASAVNTTL